ncbi:transmembrane protein, putative [Bodo saltans]|uniref:Transmembrane protein, putative n=1 Tax=Bodo saltans TaxID=75058 RepID=A0A0S4JRT7_BODSA|nr:transmembrane protein, putative [Bodo saltans]|eukprot:CUG94236.1 transmembrane protein, putative [Bodo saltans]
MAGILKIDHPHRKQRITLVTTPRYATEEFYKDWVYQPYAKEHKLYVCNDILVPTYVFAARLLINRGKFPGYKYFTPQCLPDSVDMQITRRELFNSEKPIKCNVLTLTMTLNMMRDKRHKWLERRVKRIVGVRYFNHPRVEDESIVLMMPPHYAATAINNLQDLGFVVRDRVEADCGDIETLKKLSAYSDIGQFAALSYIWMLLVLFLYGEGLRGMAAFAEYKREMIVQAGRDPKEFGL